MQNDSKGSSWEYLPSLDNDHCQDKKKSILEAGSICLQVEGKDTCSMVRVKVNLPL
jgi:hypothetical protein